MPPPVRAPLRAPPRRASRALTEHETSCALLLLALAVSPGHTMARTMKHLRAPPLRRVGLPSHHSPARGMVWDCQRTGYSKIRRISRARRSARQHSARSDCNWMCGAGETRIERPIVTVKKRSRCDYYIAMHFIAACRRRTSRLDRARGARCSVRSARQRSTQRGRGIHRIAPAADVNLEVQMRARGLRVSRIADVANDLARAHTLPVA